MTEEPSPLRFSFSFSVSAEVAGKVGAEESFLVPETFCTVVGGLSFYWTLHLRRSARRGRFLVDFASANSLHIVQIGTVGFPSFRHPEYARLLFGLGLCVFPVGFCLRDVNRKGLDASGAWPASVRLGNGGVGGSVTLRFKRPELMAPRGLMNALHSVFAGRLRLGGCDSQLMGRLWAEAEAAGPNCDLQLVCADGEHKAHVAVLSAQTTFIGTHKKRNVGGGEGHVDWSLDLREFPKSAVAFLLRCVYLSQVAAPDADDVVPVLELLRVLQLPDALTHLIRTLIEKKLVFGDWTGQAWAMGGLGDRHELRVLRNLAVTHVASHISAFRHSPDAVGPALALMVDFNMETRMRTTCVPEELQGCVR